MQKIESRITDLCHKDAPHEGTKPTPVNGTALEGGTIESVCTISF